MLVVLQQLGFSLLSQLEVQFELLLMLEVVGFLENKHDRSVAAYLAAWLNAELASVVDEELVRAGVDIQL